MTLRLLSQEAPLDNLLTASHYYYLQSPSIDSRSTNPLTPRATVQDPIKIDTAGPVPLSRSFPEVNTAQRWLRSANCFQRFRTHLGKSSVIDTWFEDITVEFSVYG